MTQKCVHKGCGKEFTSPDEECHYHPGGPEFHEGLKGWLCCKTRVFTFDEFLSIPPCTTGKHSTVDDTPAPPPPPPAKKAAAELPPEQPVRVAAAAPPPPPPPPPASTSVPTASPAPASTLSPSAPTTTAPNAAPPKDESDDESLPVPEGAKCRRRGCDAVYDSSTPRDSEVCTHHPGVPIFHEGSKGWSCCKRRVLEFDQFLKIEGCKEKRRHVFVGKKKDAGERETVENVRTDFYQTMATVNVALFLKNVDKEQARVVFAPRSIDVDLPTTDNKHFKRTIPLFAGIKPDESTFKVMGTKVEMVLAKADGTSWPVLRSDETVTGERFQIGNARKM